jgi:cell division protein FtsZ
MESGKRASMREGPLAALFRKTDEEGASKAEVRHEPVDEPERSRPQEAVKPPEAAEPKEAARPEQVAPPPELEPDRLAGAEEPRPASSRYDGTPS